MPRQLTRSTVRIYGALSALGNNSGNVLEGLLPFFDPILRLHNGKKLDPDVIAAEIRETYKWNFNADLVETFVPYLERHGWISADIRGAQDTPYTIHIADGGDLSAPDQTIESELRAIATQFKAFSEALSPLTTISLTVEEFEDILVEWLLYVEAFSAKSIEFREHVRPDAAGKIRKVFEVPNTTSLRDEEKFLCARFVKHAIEKDQASAEVLARIAAIGLLTEVVQDFVKPVTAVDKTDLVVYLDAPVAMELLGVSGRLARDNTAPIVAELIRIGASVRIFGQSIDEIKNSLQAVLKNPRPTGPTAQALLRREVLREYVREVSLNPAPLLEKIGVKAAYRTREQTPSEHQYFTSDDWRDFFSKLSYAERQLAREHDADITSFVMRQRRGKTSNDLFKSQAIVVTRNGLLAQIVRRAFMQKDALPEDAVPAVVHRRVLATAIWLRTGMGAGDLNIPKRMLLASCEYVLAIRPGVVDAVKRLTDALGDAEKSRQLDLLISQDRSAQTLMDKTLGVPNVVTEHNLSLLWDEMLHPYLEEEREKGREALNKARSDERRRSKDAAERIQNIQEERAREAALLESQLEARRLEDHDAISALCDDVAKTIRMKMYARAGAGLFLGAVFSLPLLMETTPLVRGASFLIGWLLAYLTATGGRLVGTSIDEARALNSLSLVAERRKLSTKLQQFGITWEKDHFVVRIQPKPPDDESTKAFQLS